MKKRLKITAKNAKLICETMDEYMIIFKKKFKGYNKKNRIEILELIGLLINKVAMEN